MPFTQLPPEIILQIASWIDSESDLASLAQVNRDIYNTLITELYLRNAKNPKKSAIIIAARSGNCSALKRALQAWTVARGPSELPTSGGPSKYTPLLSAAIRGHLEAIRILLEYGVDPNERDRSMRTPLNAASTRGHTAVVEALLAQPNIKVNAYDTDKQTPICGAARNGHAEIVKMLLSAGAHAGFVRKTGWQTPLHSAIRHKQAELVRLLVNRDDVDPNALGSNGTPLETAVEANEEDLVKILLTDKRINPDLTTRSMFRTPLLEAALKNNDAMVRLLLEAGANKEIQDSTSLSPAMLLDAPSAEARHELIRERSLTGIKDHDASVLRMLSSRDLSEN
ncbi:Ankyrin-1 [Penicillium subrubescens]|uniref:Ankyrin-1 n=2 Tax=Penicillium subrubescens TaxID=1316194 RepID=A0A1Q5TU85_9EURO|nr:Ankyrin-1 [Penicillium subrubescens]